MSIVIETCGCGARWQGHDAFRSEREAFREAHAACRQGEAVNLAGRILEFLIRSHRDSSLGYEDRKAMEESFAIELRELRGES